MMSRLTWPRIWALLLIRDDLNKLAEDFFTKDIFTVRDDNAGTLAELRTIFSGKDETLIPPKEAAGNIASELRPHVDDEEWAAMERSTTKVDGN